jgi:hypothetical protein
MQYICVLLSTIYLSYLYNAIFYQIKQAISNFSYNINKYRAAMCNLSLKITIKTLPIFTTNLLLINKFILISEYFNATIAVKRLIGGFLMENKKFLYYFTKSLIEFMICSGFLVCAAVPFLTYKVASIYPFINSIAFPIMTVLLISGIMAIYILWELRRIFKSIVNTSPFNLQNVSILRRISIAAFIISAAFIVKCFFWFTLATVIIVIIFAIAALFCLVLADVFTQAVLYKEEIDLTV